MVVTVEEVKVHSSSYISFNFKRSCGANSKYISSYCTSISNDYICSSGRSMSGSRIDSKRSSSSDVISGSTINNSKVAVLVFMVVIIKVVKKLW